MEKKRKKDAISFFVEQQGADGWRKNGPSARAYSKLGAQLTRLLRGCGHVDLSRYV